MIWRRKPSSFPICIRLQFVIFSTLSILLAVQNVELQAAELDSPSCRKNITRFAFSIATAPFKAVAWPLNTKRKAIITTTSVLGVSAFVAPIYSTHEGKISPALQTYYYGRDWWNSSSGNEAQLRLLESSSPSSILRTKISDQNRLSELAQKLNEDAKAFPQGVRISQPERKAVSK